jgi:hypothetical protein
MRLTALVFPAPQGVYMAIVVPIGALRLGVVLARASAKGVTPYQPNSAVSVGLRLK